MKKQGIFRGFVKELEKAGAGFSGPFATSMQRLGRVFSRKLGPPKGRAKPPTMG